MKPNGLAAVRMISWISIPFLLATVFISLNQADKALSAANCRKQ